MPDTVRLCVASGKTENDRVTNEDHLTFTTQQRYLERMKERCDTLQSEFGQQANVDQRVPADCQVSFSANAMPENVKNEEEIGARN